MRFFVFVLAFLEIYIAYPFLPILNVQSDCVRGQIRNDEIIESKSFDIDEDGTLDEVVVYGKGDLNVLGITHPTTAECEIVLLDYLTYRTVTPRNQAVAVRSLEQKELTGDTNPELYLWLEKSGKGPREDGSIHAIYTKQKGTWYRAFYIENCLAFNSFEFRESQNGGAKDVYSDQDESCEPPWSAGRTYMSFRWDGRSFILDKSGLVPNSASQTYPVWVDYVCFAFIMVPIVATILLVGFRVRRNKALN